LILTGQPLDQGGDCVVEGCAGDRSGSVRQIDPHYALIVGMCYGLKPDRQHLGDVLVSEKITDLDLGKLVDPPSGDGPAVEVPRGESVNPSPMLVTAIRAARREWSRTRPDVPVEVGLMLSWGKLVNHEPTVQRLRVEHPDAIGAEMEGAGFYAATRAGRVEGVLIKAICDWGHHRDPETLEVAKRSAARNSAEFVMHLVLVGIFARSPAQRLGNNPS
jgi:nucleoside phosphorylase